MNCQQRRACTR